MVESKANIAFRTKEFQNIPSNRYIIMLDNDNEIEMKYIVYVGMHSCNYFMNVS